MARIVIAEDDRHISRVLSLWVTRNGHEVLLADNGLQALDLIRQHQPDTVITDVNMPGMNGMDLLEALRGENLVPHQVLVLTSRCDQIEIENRARQLGAVVHPKPFSPQNLMATIEVLLQKRWGSTAEPDSMAMEQGGA